MLTWARSAGLAVVLTLGLTGCGTVEEQEGEDGLGQAEQAYLIECSAQDPSPCYGMTSPFVCNIDRGECVPVCDNGTVCPTHRYCCY